MPARTAHCTWNAGSEPTRTDWRVTPALRTEEMIRHIDRGRSPLRDLRMPRVFRNEFRIGRPRG